MSSEDEDKLMDFLRDLDKADLEVSDWEANFIESMLKQDSKTFNFSPKQKEVIAEMVVKYGNRI